MVYRFCDTVLRVGPNGNWQCINKEKELKHLFLLQLNKKKVKLLMSKDKRCMLNLNAITYPALSLH